MKKVKWENIAFVIMLIYGTICIIMHKTNDISYLEIPMYFGQALLVRYSVKYVRKNTKEFIKEINDLIQE